MVAVLTSTSYSSLAKLRKKRANVGTRIVKHVRRDLTHGGSRNIWFERTEGLMMLEGLNVERYHVSIARNEMLLYQEPNR